MATNVVMPQMGESIAEGTIVRWIKKVGDAVDRDEPLFEISTDKVDAEIPSPAAGVLTEIKVKEGETVPVNSVVAVIGAAGEAAAAPAARQSRRRSSSEGRRVGAAAEAAGTVSPRRQGRSVREPRPLRRHSRGTGVETRRTAVEGRAAAAEVLAARAADRAGAQRRHPADPGHRHQRPRDQAGHPRLHRVWRGGAAALPLQPRRRCAPAAHGPAYRPGENVQIVPMSVMRKKIAEHMVLSAHTSPHVYSVYEVNFGRVSALREKKKAEFEAAGAKLTFTAFIAKVVVDALRQFPDRQRLDRRRQHRLQEGHQPRDRRGARERADRAGDPQRRREEPARPEPRDQRSRRARALEEAESRRSAGRHVHDHQPRHLRRALRPAADQSAAGRDPRRRRASRSGPS